MLPRLAVFILCLAIAGGISAQPTPVQFTLTREMAVDGEVEALNAFWTIAVGRDGRVIIPQWREGQFLVYDNRGKRIGAFGRTGQGPGEFDRNIQQFGLHGDTIWVHDFNRRRITFVSPALKLIRTQPWSDVPKNAPQSDRRAGPLSMQFSRLYRDGSQLGQLSFGPPDPESGHRTDSRFIIVDASGNIVVHVAKSPAPTGRVYLPQELGLGADVPFAARPATAVSPDGDRIAFAVPQAPSGSRGSYVITVLQRTGDTVFSKTYDYTPQRIPAKAKSDALEEMDRRLRRVISEGPDAGGRPADEIMAKVRPLVPATYQPFREIRFGEDESIWLQLNDTNPRPRYRMMDGKGATLGDVVLPERSMLGAATRTQLWAIELNTDNVPSLVRYRISRQP